MTSVRLDPDSRAVLDRLAERRDQNRAEVIRDAIELLASYEAESPSAYDRLRPFIGIPDSGGRDLSKQTGRRVRDLLEKRRHG